ncbi:hypothetical protein L917_14552, partial [Phytophthora nicotianae]
RQVTSQVARNFIRKLQSGSTTQSRLKLLLNSLAEEHGGDVFVIRDQMEVTCGIVIQSAVQIVVLEQWGESLTLDFTRGTNNGVLRRRLPLAVAFLYWIFFTLNQQAITLEKLFSYFKEINPTWTKVKSFVIDKHFVEWSVLKIRELLVTSMPIGFSPGYTLLDS